MLFAFAMPAFAITTTVNLVPIGIESGILTVDLVMDASEAPGDHPGAIGGEIEISYNSDLASFSGFSFNAPAISAGGPDVTPGSPEMVFLAFENAESVGVIGTFTFTVIGAAGSIINIGLDDADPFGSFANTQPTNQPFFPVFTGTSVAIPQVPVPAAVWLMMSGLGLLGFRARRQRS